MANDPKQDFLSECLSDFKQLPIPQFTAAFCNQCQNRQCMRSLFTNSSTAQKLIKHSKLLEFVDPTKVPHIEDFLKSIQSENIPSMFPKGFQFQETAKVTSLAPEVIAPQYPQTPVPESSVPVMPPAPVPLVPNSAPAPAKPRMQEIKAKPGDTIKMGQ